MNRTEGIVGGGGSEGEGGGEGGGGGVMQRRVSLNVGVVGY